VIETGKFRVLTSNVLSIIEKVTGLVPTVASNYGNIKMAPGASKTGVRPTIITALLRYVSVHYEHAGCLYLERRNVEE
jgi:hypothetical protein